MNNNMTDQPAIVHQYKMSGQQPRPLTTTSMEVIRVLHVAIEYGQAVLGGLGMVATQIVDAQNRFVSSSLTQFEASIITPYYKNLYKDYLEINLVAECVHQYNSQYIISKIYLVQQGLNKHYLVEPPEQLSKLFEINSVHEIYADVIHSSFIERIKYFNSAVAGFVNDSSENTDILQLHDWQAALVPILLRTVYHNNLIRSVFVVHIDNADRGRYHSDLLKGIGLQFQNGYNMLKAIGLIYADKIVAVSPSFLRECLCTKSDNIEIEALRKIFVLAKVLDQKTHGILNGFNFDNYCQVNKLITDPENVYSEKLRIKYHLSRLLCGSRSEWKINPELPLILYVGRFSPEKGVDTFPQVISVLKNKAVFIAVGRGITDEIFFLVTNHSRRTDNVFITFSEEEQKKYIAIMRAGADFTFVPSHRESCGLTPMEGFANGSLCITSGIGGLIDSVIPLIHHDKDNTSGNGIFYEDMPNSQQNPSLILALNNAITIWQELTELQKNKLQIRIINEAKRFDWLTEEGALSQYLTVYKETLSTSSTASSKKTLANRYSIN